MYLSPYFHNDPPPETSLRSGLQYYVIFHPIFQTEATKPGSN